MPLREGQETPSEKIKRLQQEIATTVEHELTALKGRLFACAEQCAELRDWPMLEGEKEEFRQLGEAISASLERGVAIRARSS